LQNSEGTLNVDNDTGADVREGRSDMVRPGNGDGAKRSPATSAAYFRAAAAILTAAPSVVNDEVLAELLAHHYALSGRIKVLSSEVEGTVEVILPDASRLILKTSRQPEAVDSFRFQSAAISAVEGASGFVAPRILRTRGGALMFEHDGLSGYLQTCVAGTPLHLMPRTPDLLREAGKALGQLNLALGHRDLPAMHRPVLWHIGCWPRLLELQQYLPHAPVTECVRQAMTEFAEHIEPRIGDVAWQITHNDPSPFNMLATDNGIAFIDFGDGCWGPRIQDLAIAASHVVSDPALALGGAEHLIAGYASVLPLSRLDATLLVGLMKARQSALILINYWRSHLFPENAQYIKKNVARAERGLSILASLGAAEGPAAVIEATSMA
jgi:Ser/Thr protein kinase RdoA (MazF antagonist)